MKFKVGETVYNTEGDEFKIIGVIHRTNWEPGGCIEMRYVCEDQNGFKTPYTKREESLISKTEIRNKTLKDLLSD